MSSRGSAASWPPRSGTPSTCSTRRSSSSAASSPRSPSSDEAELERAVAAQTVPTIFEGTRIVVAKLGEDRLLIGAGELALAPLLDDPESVLSTPR